MTIFVLTGALGVGVASGTQYEDLGVWGAIAFCLAVTSYLGYRGKRKEEARQQTVAGAAIGAAPRARMGVPQSYCPNCGTGIMAGTRFCPHCGTAVTPPTP